MQNTDNVIYAYGYAIGYGLRTYPLFYLKSAFYFKTIYILWFYLIYSV